MSNPIIKPTLLSKKIVLKTDTIPTKGSENIITSDALANALEKKSIISNDAHKIVPTGDIIIGKLDKNDFYIKDPNFLGTRWIKAEPYAAGKIYYDMETGNYYMYKPVIDPATGWHMDSDFKLIISGTPAQVFKIDASNLDFSFGSNNIKSATFEFPTIVFNMLYEACESNVASGLFIYRNDSPSIRNIKLNVSNYGPYSNDPERKFIAMYGIHYEDPLYASVVSCFLELRYKGNTLYGCCTIEHNFEFVEEEEEAPIEDAPEAPIEEEAD